MSFDFSTLVTDRTQADVAARNVKGTYNAADLNRVTAAMEALDGIFRALGYVSGYKPILVGKPSYLDITPRMTSNTTPDGYIASASSEISVPRQAWCAFDGISGLDDEANRWHSGLGMPQWIMMKFPESHTVTKFSIKNADNTHLGINEFELRGSNDGAMFTTLGSYTNPSDFGITSEYAVQNPGSYIYYQIYITSSHHTGPYAIIDEIKFYELETTEQYIWTEADIPLQSQMEQYLANLAALRGVLSSVSADPPTPESMEFLSYVEANHIEQILLNIEVVLTTIGRSFLRANMPWAAAGNEIYVRNGG